MGDATRKRIHQVAKEFFRLNPELSPTALPGLQDDQTPNPNPRSNHKKQNFGVLKIWPDTAYELARKVRDQLIAAGKNVNAPKVFTTGLEQACAQYLNSKGKPFTPKVLRESLRQWELKNKG